MGVSSKNNEHRRMFQDVSGRTTLLAADDLSVTARVLVAGKASYTIFVQRITVSVVTPSAQTLLFQDDAGTPRQIAEFLGTAAGVGATVFEFGEEGAALTEGKDFELKNGAAGLAAEIYWEGYMRLTGVITTANHAAA